MEKIIKIDLLSKHAWNEDAASPAMPSVLFDRLDPKESAFGVQLSLAAYV